MTETDEGLDIPIWGAEPIGRAAGLFKENGEVDVRATYYLLERGVITAKRVKAPGKNRGQWVSTPRLVRNSVLPSHEAA